MRRGALALFAWICWCAVLTAAASEKAMSPSIAWQGRTMGSPYTVQLTHTNLTQVETDSIRKAIDQCLDRVNAQLSNYRTDSELTRFNHSAADVPFQVSPDFAQVTRFALELAGRSHGAFDPTLGPLINLWGFGEQSSDRKVPEDAALAKARSRTGWQNLSVTAQGELVKRIPDLALDLGGVGKGFGVDQMAKLLRQRGFTNFQVAIAGEVFVSGHNERGTKWHLGISSPVDQWREGDPMAAGVWLSNQALSTSGDYQKFWMDSEGRRRSHIIDTRTGQPVAHNLAAVSVVAADSMTADALGTTLVVLGLEDGLRLVDTWTNAAALFIMREADGGFQQVPSARFEALAEYER